MPSRNGAAEVQLLIVQLKSHIFLDSSGSWDNQVMVALPETGMVNGRGHCPTLLSLQSLFGYLVVWGAAFSLEVVTTVVVVN